MYFIIITWLLYKITGDAFYTGLLVGLGFVPSLIMNLLFGVIVDRYDRKLLSIIANLGSTIAITFILVTIFLELLHPWVIIGVQMIIQLMGSLLRPAIQSFIAEIFPEHQLPKVYSQSGSAGIMGGLLGASLGGIMIGFLSEMMALSIVVLSFATATFLLVLIKEGKIKERAVSIKNKKTVITDLSDGFFYLKRNTFLFNLFGVMFVGQLVFHTTVGFLSVYTMDYLESTVTLYGFLDASLSVGGISAGLLGTWWWKKQANHLPSRSLLIVSFGLLMLGVTPIIAVAFIGTFLVGLGTTWIRILLQSIQQIATEKEYHGRMASYRMICNQGSVVISAPILGWVVNQYGANNMFIILFILVAVAALFSIRLAKHEWFMEITKQVNS